MSGRDGHHPPLDPEHAVKTLTRYILPIFFMFFVLIGLSSPASAIERQMTMNWCWAASVQEVMAQKGVYLTQPQVAARLTGWPQDRPAYIHEVVWLLNGMGVGAWRAGRPGTPQELYQTLSMGYRMIAFVQPTAGPVGHFVVFEGYDPWGNIVVADPANGMTQAFPLQTVYYGWRWADAVVVP